MLSEKGRFSVREKPASSLELEAESDDEGKVVAEATLVAVAIIGTEGLDSSVLFVFFQKEGGIVNKGLGDGITEGWIDKNMVDALPLAFVAVGATGTMTALGITGNVTQAVGT